MPLWPKTKRARRLILLAFGLLTVLLAAVYWIGEDGVFHREDFSNSAVGLLVLEDCDSDFLTPPFEDAVVTFGAKCKPVRKVTGLNICQTVGGCRSLSVANDGGFFTVCENASRKLAAYRLTTGERLWSVDGDFTSATVSRDRATYALASDGTIYGKETLLIDPAGKIAKQVPVGGFDLVLDEHRNALWLVGSNVKKCDLELNVLLEVNSIGWCGVSVDVNADGSVWVAEREHPNVALSTNRLLRISPGGKVLQVVCLPFSPSCLRVHHSDGTVWVTGRGYQKSVAGRLLEATEKRTGRLPIGKKIRDSLKRPRVWFRTRKYDQNGALLCEVRRGGFSLDIDQTDGSVWVGGMERVFHYSRLGNLLGQARGVSPDQKYVAVVPGHGSHGPREVTVEQLLASPDAFDGDRVVVKGFLLQPMVGDIAIYQTEPDYHRPGAEGHVRLDLDPNQRDLMPYQLKRCAVEGTFHASHGSGAPGRIGEITRLANL